MDDDAFHFATLTQRVKGWLRVIRFLSASMDVYLRFNCRFQVHSANSSGSDRNWSLNSTNGTCALNQSGSLAIALMDLAVLLQIKYSPSPTITNASNLVPTPCRANSKSPMLCRLLNKSARRSCTSVAKFFWKSSFRGPR